MPKPDQYRQIGGDMNPSQHGAIVARFDGDAVDIFEIEPVRAYVGDRDALQVGFPFWSREAYYDPEDLDPARTEVQRALESHGLNLDDIPKEHRALTIAECLLRYGSGVDQGPGGWAKDVLGDKRVLWWGTKRPRGWRYLADEDREFRALQREARS
jgi:hypothetical protein